MFRMRSTSRHTPHHLARRTAIGERAIRAALWFLGIALAFTLLAHPVLAQSDDSAPDGAVYVVPITGVIDLGLAPYLSRVLEEAAAAAPRPCCCDIDTPGGRLDAVLQMRDALLGSEVRTIAFVDRTAFSAGALIAIASEEIYMAPGAVMGAATPVDGATGETASEKIISAVRTTFKATAEARGRDPLVAEAMVDPDVAIDGLVARGDLLTLTADEAVAWGYAEGSPPAAADVLTAAGLPDAPSSRLAPSLAERLVRFITDPAVSSILIAFGVLLLIGDLFVEGFGIAGAAGSGSAGALFLGTLSGGAHRLGGYRPRRPRAAAHRGRDSGRAGVRRARRARPGRAARRLLPGHARARHPVSRGDGAAAGLTIVGGARHHRARAGRHRGVSRAREAARAPRAAVDGGRPGGDGHGRRGLAELVRGWVTAAAQGEGPPPPTPRELSPPTATHSWAPAQRLEERATGRHEGRIDDGEGLSGARPAEH